MASTIVGAYPCARAYADTYARPIHGVASLLTERAVETIGPRTSATRGVEARGVKPVSITAVLLTRRRRPNGSSNGGLCEESHRCEHYAEWASGKAMFGPRWTSLLCSSHGEPEG